MNRTVRSILVLLVSASAGAWSLTAWSADADEAAADADEAAADADDAAAALQPSCCSTGRASDHRRQDGRDAHPPGFRTGRRELHTWTGWGSIPYWSTRQQDLRECTLQ